MGLYRSKATTDEVLGFIRTFQKAFPGISPSYREIMEEFDIHSTGTMNTKMKELEAEGLFEPYSNDGKPNYRGILFHDTVLLTKADADELGLDWNKITTVRKQALAEFGE